MTVLLKLCGGAIIAAILAFVIKEGSKTASAVLVSFTALLLLSGAVLRFSSSIESIKTLLDESGMTSYGTLMIKSLGIGIVVKTAGGICRDLGQESVSSGIELAGKAEILLLCLPLILDTVETLKGLLP